MASLLAALSSFLSRFNSCSSLPVAILGSSDDVSDWRLTSILYVLANMLSPVSLPSSVARTDLDPEFANSEAGGDELSLPPSVASESPGAMPDSGSEMQQLPGAAICSCKRTCTTKFPAEDVEATRSEFQLKSEEARRDSLWSKVQRQVMPDDCEDIAKAGAMEV